MARALRVRRELERVEAAQVRATAAAVRAARQAPPELAAWIDAHDRALAAVVRCLWARSRLKPRGEPNDD